MKLLKVLSIFILLTLFFTSCDNKTAQTQTITSVESSKFTEEEISDAINYVIDNFNFPACTLEDVWYDEKWQDDFNIGYIPDGITEDNVIIILSNFYVDESGDNPVLTPGMLYEKYSWILIRNSKNEDWELFDVGY